MAGIPFRPAARIRFPLVLILGLGIAGCDESGGFNFGGGGGETGGEVARSQSTELVERDVEAPEIFQITESGLWDGRPSLGGVWVAHPDVTDPERVIIRNEANGSFVIGALFRRERENPGPALQVSSDAAIALEMLAGAPAMLNVTALRREEAAEPAAPAAVADFDNPDAIAATPLDPIAGAAAAIDAADTMAVTPLPPAEAPAPAATSTLDRPYIQIGIFSVEGNANATADQMLAENLTARVVAQESQGREFWRVIVGPTRSEGERTTLLDQVKALGFADAYFVRS